MRYGWGRLIRMGDVALTMACGPYDRFEALRYGAVSPQDIALEYRAVSPPHDIFARMVDGEFDISEMSIILFLPRRIKGPFPFVAIPVFPSRVFRHGNIFVNRRAGIAAPKDLEGRRVGVQEYRQSAALWIRGMLRDDHGVDTDSIHWVEGGVNELRGPQPKVEERPDRELSITHIGAETMLSTELAEGRIDALIGAQQPFLLNECDDIVRMFPDYRAAERDYFERTGIFPIMHTMVIREALHDENPWIAANLYRACEESKARAIGEMRFSGAMRYMTPWLQDDVEEMDRVFGGDPWPYGLEANRHQLETLTRYLVEEGFIAEPVSIDDLFVAVEGV